MANQTNTDYFTEVTVSTTSFADCMVSWPFTSVGLSILVENGVNIQYSFDGVNEAGNILSNLFLGIIFDNRQESRIYFRLISAGSSSSVRFEAWSA